MRLEQLPRRLRTCLRGQNHESFAHGPRLAAQRHFFNRCVDQRLALRGRQAKEEKHSATKIRVFFGGSHQRRQDIGAVLRRGPNRGGKFCEQAGRPECLFSKATGAIRTSLLAKLLSFA